MGFWHIYMGIEGGGEVAVAVGPGQFAAGEVYHPGFQAGETYHPGFQAGETYHPGFQKGENR